MLMLLAGVLIPVHPSVNPSDIPLSKASAFQLGLDIPCLKKQKQSTMKPNSSPQWKQLLTTVQQK